MDPDLALVIGIVLGVLSVPSILSDKRAPRASTVTVLIAGGLILFATQNKPGGIAFGDIPDTFVSVIARYMP